MNLGTGPLPGVCSQGASVPGISPEASCLHGPKAFHLIEAARSGVLWGTEAGADSEPCCPALALHPNNAGEDSEAPPPRY